MRQVIHTLVLVFINGKIHKNLVLQLPIISSEQDKCKTMLHNKSCIQTSQTDSRHLYDFKSF